MYAVNNRQSGREIDTTRSEKNICPQSNWPLGATPPPGVQTLVAIAREYRVADLDINDDLPGRRVCNPARPEWGVGTVLRVQTMTVDGQPVHRVSVQFATGHRTVVVPPGRLVEPQGEPTRAAGWLDQAGRRTLDDRLTNLPESVREFLGTCTQRIVVLSRLYTLGDDGTALLKWARSQAGVADPLSHWTRDEIRAAFDEFCRRRDALLRELAATLRQTQGPAAVRDALAEVPDEARERMLAVLQ
jgi:hypothetical protein